MLDRMVDLFMLDRMVDLFMLDRMVDLFMLDRIKDYQLYSFHNKALDSFYNPRGHKYSPPLLLLTKT